MKSRLPIRLAPLAIALLASLLAWSCGGGLRPVEQEQDQKPPLVLVIPIEGTISEATVALVHRGLRHADDANMSHVVLRIDSPGGLVQSMREVESLLDRIQDSGVNTVAFVQDEALSAAAYIALVCNQLYMVAGSEIGAIVQGVLGPGGMREIPDDDIKRKAYAAMRKDVRSRLEKRSPKLPPGALRVGEAMVDPGMQLYRVSYMDGGFEVTKVVDRDELAGLQQRGVDIITQIKFSTPVVLTHGEAEDVGISQGTLNSLEQLVTDHLLLLMDDVAVLESSWSEDAVGWLGPIQPILFVLGFVLLLLELKTPGFAVPGVLGVLLLSLGLFYSHLVGLAEWTEILLFFLGIAAIAVEIFVLPGFIVFGVVGFLCLVAALILSQQSFVLPGTATQEDIFLANLLNLVLMFALVLVVAMALWKLLPRVPVLNRVFIAPPEERWTGASTVFERGDRGEKLRAFVGREGFAATMLRPSGVLELDGERIDVVAQGDYVEAGARVRVVGIDANRVVVERVEDDAGERGSVGIVLLLTVVGLALVVAEVLLVSFGLISLLSAVCLVSAVFLAFQESQGFGFGVLAFEAVAAPVVLYFAFKALPKTSIGKHLLLEAPQHDDVSKGGEEKGLHDYMNKTGVTLSALRPSGFARIDGRKVDVVTRGEMLDKDCPVRVIEVQGNRVVVTRYIAPAAEQPDSGSTSRSS